MIGLLFIGVIAGIIAGISPCILPVLPVIFLGAASTAKPETSTVSDTDTKGVDPTGMPVEGAQLEGAQLEGAYLGDVAAMAAVAPKVKVRSRRPVVIVAGIVVSFSVATLAGTALLSALGLPQDLLKWLGSIVLALFAFGLIYRRVGDLLERPFARIIARNPSSDAGSFTLGLGVGMLFIPCAGPVLTAVTVLGATHRIGWRSAALTLAFSVGAAIPLLAIAIAGDRIGQRISAIRQRARSFQVVSGLLMLLMAILIFTGAFNGLQTLVPGYTDALQNHVESNSFAKCQLDSIQGKSCSTVKGTLQGCPSDTSGLVECGQAPAFKEIAAWLNTPGGKPLTLASLRGRVVLVDFWTYSCINCERTLPHVEAWYSRYKQDGFEVIGVHTPEFAFEHVVSNVKQSLGQLGVQYPVAVDNSYGTWDAYDNQYWPAEYLIDASGTVRHVDFGEGGYQTTESLIRTLLKDSDPHIQLPPPTSIANYTPTEATNPETYVGFENEQYIDNSIVDNRETPYSFPSQVPFGALALSGLWTEGSQQATAGPATGGEPASIELGYQAKDVYLVIGGSGTVQISTKGVSGDGGGQPAISTPGGAPGAVSPPEKTTATLSVGGIPKLYTLLSTQFETTGTLILKFSPGVQAYDFTFG